MAPKAPRPRRLHWLLMALVPLLWGIGEGLWALWPLISGASPESSPLLMGIYSAASFSVAFTVVFFSIYERRDRIPLQFIVDSAAIFAVTLGLLYFVFFDKRLGKLFSLSAESLNVRIDLFLDLRRPRLRGGGGLRLLGRPLRLPTPQRFLLAQRPRRLGLPPLHGPPRLRRPPLQGRGGGRQGGQGRARRPAGLGLDGPRPPPRAGEPRLREGLPDRRPLLLHRGHPPLSGDERHPQEAQLPG